MFVCCLGLSVIVMSSKIVNKVFFLTHSRVPQGQKMLNSRTREAVKVRGSGLRFRFMVPVRGSGPWFRSMVPVHALTAPVLSGTHILAGERNLAEHLSSLTD